MESTLNNYCIVYHMTIKLAILMLHSSVGQPIFYNAIFQGKLIFALRLMVSHALFLASAGNSLKMDRTVTKMHYQTVKMELIVILQTVICAVELL